ncbi:MAG: carboxypeptidase-like regulatory domain-containing protein [Ignavibacteriota bacterium]
MKFSRSIIFLGLFTFFALPSVGFSQIGKVVALVKGVVTGPGGQPANDVTVTFFKGSELIKTTRSTLEGKFTQIVQPGTQYRVTFSGSTFYYHEEQLSVPASDVYQIVPMSVSLKQLELGSPFHFSNLIFEPSSSAISSSVMSDLDNIASAMKRNAKLAVNITVYPDEAATGKKAAMESTLAEARKSAMMTFFLSKNISSSNVSIEVSQSVPSHGTFERMISQEAPAVKGKKKKKAPATTAKKVMVPQNAEVTMKLNS